MPRILSFSLVAASMAVLAILIASGLQLQTTSAASITVNTTDDEANADGDCSLREAIGAANSDAAVDACTAGSGPDVITVPDGLYLLTDGELDIFTDLTINGTSAGATAIDGNANERIFDIGSKGPIEVTISGLTVQNGLGDGDGGGIAVDSTANVTLDKVFVTNNETSSDGGGIANDGSVTLIDSSVTGNEAGDEGGGIYNQGPDTLIVDGSKISGNTAEEGGGIMNEFEANAAIKNSTIGGNTATSDGGGIENSQCCGTDPLVITNTTISGNTAAGLGGGIDNTDEGVLDLTNVTISGNSAGDGGGIATEVQATLTNVTLTSNSASDGTGGILINGKAGVALGNTILSDNTGGNCGGSPFFTSAGGNLEDTDTCGLIGTGDEVNTDPMLGPLLSNGGPTQTHALLAGSPAIDTASDAICPSNDQRGVARPVDGNEDGTAVCDIGAYEFEPAAAPTPTVSAAVPTATVAATGLPPTGSGPGDGGVTGWLVAGVAIAGAAVVALGARRLQRRAA